MKELYKNLKPERVFYYFEKISDIPRGSKDTKRISEYIESVGNELNLYTYRDELGNVIIRKEATKGKENVPGVILQGHMDMVCEKTLDSKHDFFNDPLDLNIDGDFLYAKDTTLGGDDGIAVAYMLAILEDNTISHPLLECIFTVDEEIGLLGAKGLDMSDIKGKYLINLDSEEEGFIWAGCAGGMTINNTFKYDKITCEGIKCDITISNLAGGHSGSEIDKGHMNAVITLARVINDLYNFYGIKLVSIIGGNKDNAIPLYAKAEILAEADKLDEISLFLDEYDKLLKNEAVKEDENVSLTLDIDTQVICDVFKDEDAGDILFYLNLLPNGVYSMCTDKKEIVETSSNLGIAHIQDEVLITSSVRSSEESKKILLANKIIMLTEKMGGSSDIEGDYPAWTYKKESKLREVMSEVYKNKFGKEIETVIIHAGLECGYFAMKKPELDIVSIGPLLLDIHTTNEKLSISSSERMYEYLLEILENIR